jgi:NTE family protein
MVVATPARIGIAMSALLDDRPLHEAPLWAGLDPAARRELQKELERVKILGGEMLFSEGEPADALYMLVSGSLGVSVSASGGEQRRVARVFPPETIGEMALISHAPRSASVVALRDSVLLKLTRSAFDRLVERWPPAMLYLARLLADRLRAANHPPVPTYAPTTFALVPVTEGADVRTVAAPLLAEMRKLYGASAESLEARPDGTTEAWFHQFEARHARVLYVADRSTGEWADRCIRHADHVVLLARPGEPLLELPHGLTGGSTWRRHDLVLLQDAAARRPAPAHPSLDSLDLDLRIQVRRGHSRDLARLARTISGRAVGLVLAGGGARGFAHLGVIKALREHGCPIDLVGGTSIGSIIAAACAFEADERDLRDRIAEAFVTDPPVTDYTLPLVALTRGRKVDERLTRHFGDAAIEDLWLPFFCVSTNLTTGTAHIHRRGRLWRALRASIAIPGLLPPALEPEGVLVDGAMMNNLPADVMAGLQRGPVLAVDVAQDVALTGHGDGEGRTPLLRRLFGVPPEAPDIVSLLHRAATVSSDAQTAQARAKASLVIQPPLADVGLQAWQRFDEIVEIGYRHTCACIESGALAAFPA